jgi:PPIC-type PPIASE domain
MIRRLIREPLLHFAALGAAIFVAYSLIAVPTPDNSAIVVTADRIASLSAQFSAMHGGRPATDAELRGLIDAYVRDEMLYREGLALGLDRDDPVVRNRVRQKADILSGDAFSAEPTDADLQAYLDAHQREFDIPGRVSFEQVYFDPVRHREPLGEIGAVALKRLAQGESPQTLGDRTMLPSTMTRVMPTEIVARFGEVFEQQLAQITDHNWHGPVVTTYGAHLVRVTWREPPTRATLANARDVVAREWSRAHAAQMKEVFYRTLATRYTVQIESAASIKQVLTAENSSR